MSKNKRMGIGDMTKLSLCVAVLCISSYIVIPLPFTPIMITGQTMGVNLIGLILGPLHSGICLAIFILLGISGLPVFAGGNSGLNTLFGPTGGFIIGFLFSAVAISYFKGRKINIYRYIFTSVFIGMPINYILGVGYMAHILNISYIKALQVGVVPFIVGDLIKAFLACLIAVRLNSHPSIQALPQGK